MALFDVSAAETHYADTVITSYASRFIIDYTHSVLHNIDHFNTPEY